MLFFLCKRMVSVCVAVASFFLAVLLCVFLKDDFSLSSARAEEVTSSYYLYSASSTAKTQQSISVLDLPFVEGKSVCLTFENEGAAREYVAALIKKTGAYLQKSEFVGEVESHYFFSRKLGKTVAVSGLPVNLHIALSGKRVSVGSPLVFGGY